MNSEFNDVKEEFDKFGRTLKEVADHSSDLFTTIGALINCLKDDVGDRLHEAVISGRKTSRKINAYAEENPWKAATILAAFGFAVGWMAMKRRSPAKMESL